MAAELKARLSRLRQGAGEQGPPPPSPASHPPGARLLDDAAFIGDAASGAGFLSRVSAHPVDALIGHHAALRDPGAFEDALRRHCALVGLRSGGRPCGMPAESGRVLFLDLETTGLRGSGTLAWCFGLAWLETEGGRVIARVEQVVLESPEAEAAALDHVLKRVESAAVVVTFNGRSYDLPLLDTRCVLQRRSPARRPADIDLLAPARRLLAAGEATLIAIEGRLGRFRIDDIAGEDVPRAWFDWLRLRESAALRRAVDHNRDDLLSMVAILSWLLALAMGHRDARELASPVGHAEILARMGERGAALGRLAEAPLAAGPEARRCARLLHSLAGRAAARQHWERLVAAGDASSEPWEGLAKILEHDERDPARAAALVSEALLRVTSEAGRRRLEMRLARLLRRIRPPEQRAVSPAPPGLVDCPRFPESAWKSSLLDILSARSPRSARS